MFKILLSALFLLFLALSCASAPETQEVPFVLQELSPREKPVRPQPPPEPTVEREPVYVSGRIAEIELVGGAQKYLYLRFPEATRNLRVGTSGEIFVDQSFSDKVGNIRIVQQFPNDPGFYHAEIVDLIYTINRSALIRVQIE